jgi:hypothetical protein
MLSVGKLKIEDLISEISVTKSRDGIDLYNSGGVNRQKIENSTEVQLMMTTPKNKER